MDTIIEKITGDSGHDRQVIQKAAAIIKKGGLVAFPTETVYGLGGDAFDADAASKIYAAKGRPSDNPLIVHISDISDLTELSDDVPEVVYTLAERFWPGPLTVIIKKNCRVPDTVTGGLDTVAVRLPDNETARKFIKASGTFIAAPSANLSGRPSPTSAEHVAEDLSGRIDMIIDGGDIDIGLESTIVDMTGDVPVLLRPGFVTAEMLCGAVGEVAYDPALMSGVDGEVRPKAPGMKYRHYAPKAEMTVVEGERGAVADKIKQLVRNDISQGRKAGIMVSEENKDFFCEGEMICLGSRTNPEEIARNLFGALREWIRYTRKLSRLRE